MERESDAQDRVLVERCLGGSKDAWDQFYDRFLMLVRKVVHAHVRGGRHDVQDMVQNVFLALFTALKTYDHQYPLSKFVWLVGERVCIDEFRKSTASKRYGETVAVSQHDKVEEAAAVLVSSLDPQEDQLVRLEQCHFLKTAFRLLSDKCRELLRLRYLQELSFKEVAPLLGAKEKTLAVQAGRCLDELKGHYARVERQGYRP
jgi:RNA polymerase sigma-70 factor, ECF subfamily